MRFLPEMKQALRTLSAAAIFMAGFLVTGYAFADSTGGYGDGGYHMHSGYGGWGYHSGMMMLGPVLMIGLIVLIVIGVVMLINRSKGASGQASSGRAILDDRYAKGEIDHDEYEERKRRLTN